MSRESGGGRRLDGGRESGGGLRLDGAGESGGALRLDGAPARAMVDAPDRGQVLRKICFGGLLALQMFAVLAYGAVEYWAMAVVRMGSLLLFAVWVASVLMGGSLRLRRNPLFFPMAAFIGLVGLQYLTKRTAYLPSTREALLTLIADFLLFFVLVNTDRKSVV